jgi:hypothetical protein
MSNMHRARLYWTPIWQVLALVLLLELIGCGGGSQSSPPPPPSPDFSLAVSPQSQSVDAGSSASVSLSATALNGFSSQISVQVTGVPAGVSVSPTNITLVPGTPQQVKFNAAANAASASATVTFTGTAGSLSHAKGLSLAVSALSNGLPVRTRYLRTDATTEYALWLNQHWIIYHASTGRYFVTDPSSNQIIVIDAASQTEIGIIGVPGAFGIDQTPDGKTLYVGTLIGDVYAIDPVAMAVKQRYMASDIGPSGFPAHTALVLSDGRLALFEAEYELLTPLGIWNPTDNSITIYGAYQGTPIPCGPAGNGYSGFTLSVDRTQIILGGNNLCEMNPATGTGITAVGTSLAAVSLEHILTTPDGKYIIVPNNPLSNPVAVVFDAHTLATVAQFNVLGDTSSGSGFFVSADSTTLYTPADPNATAIIYAYDLATQQFVGWVPNIFVEITAGGSVLGPLNNPYLLATDGTGLFAGPMEEGIGFVDLSALQTGVEGTQFTSGYLKPATGPTSGGTATQWSDVAPVGTLKSIYFGSKQATAISANPQNAFVTINATSPQGKAGPADVYAFTTDGGMQLLPEAFSYGPTILEVTPNMATAEGGGTGYIYGYGFGPVKSNTIPADLQVMVAGTAAQITGFTANAYNLGYPPFPLQSVAYTIPPGVSGSAVNVVVSTNSGSTTATGAVTYLPPTQPFPLTGSALAQGIYDSYTDLYYFTDTSQIQVFSRTQEKWLSPINIPAPPGTTQRLWGIALSPNGSKLAVADASAGAIYLLNPANPTSVKTYSMTGVNAGTLPCGVAVSDSGIVYFTTVGGEGYNGSFQFLKLNTTTGQITNYGIDGPGINGNAYLRNVISSDNSRVFFDDDGEVFSIDTATDAITEALDGYTCCYGNYELALSSNQTKLTGTFYIYDSNLNGESYYAWNDREILNIAYVYGAKLSADGRLIFQPSTNGIDVLDGNRGNLRDRISLPVALSPNYDALVDDGTDNVLIAITGTGDGIAIIDLTSITEPPPLPNEHRLGLQPNRIESPSDGSTSGRSDMKHRLLQRSHVVRHATRTVLPHIK